MDIDSNNFVQRLAFVLDSIRTSEFIAFDAEFTGITAHENQHVHKYDSFEDIYQKMKHTCINFKMLQFGLCTFKWDEITKKYIARPFNFYVYKKHGRSQHGVHIVSNDAMAFLADQDMDFRRVFSRGINYHRIMEGPPVMSQSRDFMRVPKNGTFLSSETEKSMKVLLAHVKKFVFDDPVARELVLECQTPFLASYFNNKNLSNHFGFSLALQRQTIPESATALKFSKPKGFKTPPKGNLEQIPNLKNNKANGMIGNMEESKGENMEIEKIKDEVENNEQEEIKEFKAEPEKEVFVSFTVVIEEIIKLKKIIVGHNLRIDLGLIFDHFIDELPATYAEWTSQIAKYFPVILDTKQIAFHLQSSVRHLETNLDNVYTHCFVSDKTLKKYNNTAIQPHISFAKYCNDQIPHEAGFDAYITGGAFVTFLNFINYDSAYQPQKNKPKDTIDYNLLEKVLSNPINLQKAEMFVNLTPSGSDWPFDLSFDAKKGNLYYVTNPNYSQKMNTLFLYCDPKLTAQDIGSQLIIFGDIEVSVVRPGHAYVEFLSFVRPQLNPQLNLEVIKGKINSNGALGGLKSYLYLERPLFKASKIVQ